MKRGLSIGLLLLAVVVGCSDEDEPAAPQPTAPTGYENPQRLIQVLEVVLTEPDGMDYLGSLLDTDFRFVLDPVTVEAFGLPDSTLDRAQEIAVVQRMFAGEENSRGQTLAAVEFARCQPQGPWLPVPAGDPRFALVTGDLYCRYDVLLYFNMNGDFRYESCGSQVFVVAADTTLVDGEPVVRFKLSGQIDLTISKTSARATDTITWSAFKAQYM